MLQPTIVLPKVWVAVKYQRKDNNQSYHQHIDNLRKKDKSL